MSSTKNIRMIIPIKPNQLSNVDTVILQHLKNNYSGKCIENVYIINVNKVINRSHVQASGNGKYEVSVEFESEIISYTDGDNIPLIKIELVNDELKTIIGHTENGIPTLIHLTESLIHLKKDMFIPITINMVENNFGNSAAISGSLMNFPDAFYYKLTNDAVGIKSSVIKNTDKKIEKFDSVIVEFNKGSIIGKLVDFADFHKLKQGDIIFRPKHMSRLDCCYIASEEEILALNVEIISKDPLIIFNLFKKEYDNFIYIYKELDSHIPDLTYFKQCYKK